MKQLITKKLKQLKKKRIKKHEEEAKMVFELAKTTS
jgi:hypothetical protein